MSSILIGGNPTLLFQLAEAPQKILTPTWFEHAAFWSGVRRATVAPRSQDIWGSTEIWTRIAGFKVQSANHYTIEPTMAVGQIEGMGCSRSQRWPSRRKPGLKIMFRAGFEPATLCVWSTRDNHYTNETWLASRSFVLRKLFCIVSQSNIQKLEPP